MQRTWLTAFLVWSVAACTTEVEDGISESPSGADPEALTVGTLAAATVSSSLPSSLSLAAGGAGAKLVRTPPPTGSSTQLDPCAGYNGYTGAIASLTVDCRGTIGPELFSIDDRGNLRREFNECRDGQKHLLEDIDAMLSLQLRVKQLPEVRRCMGARWLTWQKEFAASGIRVCPNWKKTRVINAPTPQGAAEYGKTLPKLPSDDSSQAPAAPQETYMVELSFPGGVADQRCKDAADCAQRCAGGFEGFWLGGSGNRGLVDPLYWLLGMVYNEDSNPFLGGDYYHPMSFFGSLPGSLYGHRNRIGEPCSRYVGNMHFLLQLQRDCINDADNSTCVGRCDEPDVASTGAARPGSAPL